MSVMRKPGAAESSPGNRRARAVTQVRAGFLDTTALARTLSRGPGDATKTHSDFGAPWAFRQRRAVLAGAAGAAFTGLRPLSLRASSHLASQTQYILTIAIPSADRVFLSWRAMSIINV